MRHRKNPLSDGARTVADTSRSHLPTRRYRPSPRFNCRLHKRNPRGGEQIPRKQGKQPRPMPFRCGLVINFASAGKSKPMMCPWIPFDRMANICFFQVLAEFLNHFWRCPIVSFRTGKIQLALYLPARKCGELGLSTHKRTPYNEAAALIRSGYAAAAENANGPLMQ